MAGVGAHEWPAQHEKSCPDRQQDERPTGEEGAAVSGRWALNSCDQRQWRRGRTVGVTGN
jgi:hypothetical protein